MNHANALRAISRAHPAITVRGGTGWANGMPLPPEPWGTGPVVGLGQVNLIPPELVQGVKELITLQSDQAKKQIIDEVDKKGEEAKTRALLGGLVAGAVGAAIGIGVGIAIARRR